MADERFGDVIVRALVADVADSGVGGVDDQVGAGVGGEQVDGRPLLANALICDKCGQLLEPHYRMLYGYRHLATMDTHKAIAAGCIGCPKPLVVAVGREELPHCTGCEADQRDPMGAAGHTHQEGTMEHPVGREYGDLEETK